VAIITCFDKHGKRVAGDSVAVNGTTHIITGAGQMAVDAMNIGLTMEYVGLILNLLLVACGTEGIGGCRCPCLLGVNFVAINTIYANITVSA
jgi:hypothetical protein